MKRRKIYIENPKRKLEFSKRLLIADYIIALLIILFLAFCAIKNYIYVNEMQKLAITTGMIVDIQFPFELTSLTVILSIWIGQLGLSTTAYYVMCKSDHKVQLPMQLINTMPKEIQDKLDMTTVVSTVLNSTDN